MGTDIYGWVEFQDQDTGTWQHCIDISLLIDRDYDAFGCLFGVRNYACFRPIAANRGLPADVSTQVRFDTEEIGEYASDHTWVNLAELRAIDRDEVALGVDERVHQYRHAATGTLVYEGKATWSRDLAALLARHDQTTPEEGAQWEIGNRVYRAERLRRGDALGEDWRLLIKMMEPLGERYGAEHVRLVVWFE